MFKKINVELLDLTPALAKQFADMPTLLGERPVKAARMRYLYDIITRGYLAGVSWSVVKDTATGMTYRANGQHTSTVLANLAPEQFPAGLLATIESYETDNLATDGFLIFDMFDAKQSSRSNTDKLNTYKCLYVELASLNVEFLSNLLHGVHITYRDQGDKETQETWHRGLYLTDEHVREFVCWAHDLRHSTVTDADGHVKAVVHPWLFSKPGVVAEMFHQFLYLPDRDVVTRWWSYVLHQNHADVDHESKEYVTSLMGWQAKRRIRPTTYRQLTAKMFKKFLRAGGNGTSLAA